MLTITTPTHRGDREVVVTRRFNAPRRSLFEALTRPDLIKRWLVAPGRTLTTCDVDLRIGGGYRYRFTAPGKSSLGVRGKYQDIIRNELLVHVETWDDWDAGETLSTTTLTEDLTDRKPQTTLTLVSVFPSRQVRDAVLAAGFRDNVKATYDCLADVVTGAPIIAGFGLIA